MNLEKLKLFKQNFLYDNKFIFIFHTSNKGDYAQRMIASQNKFIRWLRLRDKHFESVLNIIICLTIKLKIFFLNLIY